MGDLSLATLAIIIANVLFSMQGFKDYLFFNKYKFAVREVQRGEYIRMLTSGFLHADWQHLIFNMITLFFFADVVIAYAGITHFVLIYTFSLILGSLFALFLHRNEPYYTAVGASGAVTGILYASILFNPNMMIIVFVIPMPAYIFGIGYLLYSIYGMKSRTDNIGHSAHFGGAVGGLIYALAYQPSLISREPLLVGGMLIPIALLFIFRKKLER
ncbi:rhomboid family intramembrane serine protease [Capnocytophaga stomatis]|uniref:rhomboid family intramembrane serine protease n=1 Tax=Capnocytophaga stomatis TaxID=1848904 RepID=UPI00194DB981|nr:rhomboid family intramembrane serine protease [Capnocytophaga stomatis]GIJ93281.1 rhomboid family intramembrane serine protease [Capnocytophaga stomatis]GIJ96413.1 rhomboid family intramembrane serine protease [Capnocytophaga stomatis]